MKALKSFRYDKTQIKKGDTFRAKGKHAEILTRAKLAELAEETAVPKRNTYLTRDLQAEPIIAITGYADLNVSQLRQRLGEKNVHLPKGYVPRAKLVELLKEQG